MLPQLLMLAELRADIPLYQIATITALAQRDAVPVGEILSRSITDLASGESDWLEQQVPGFRAAFRRPHVWSRVGRAAVPPRTRSRDRTSGSPGASRGDEGAVVNARDRPVAFTNLVASLSASHARLSAGSTYTGTEITANDRSAEGIGRTRTGEAAMTEIARLFTFVAEYDGATRLEQVSSTNLREAVRDWNVRDRVRIPPDRLLLDEPTQVEGLEGVWCFSGLDDADKLYLVHVIRTVIE